MSNVVVSISGQLDLRVKEMNQTANSVVLNKSIIQLLIRLRGYNYDSINPSVYLDASRDIVDSLFSIAQSIPDIDRIGLFSNQNMFFSNKWFDVNSKEMMTRMLARVKPVYIRSNNDAKFFLIGPHPNEWEANDKEMVFSLQRIIKNSDEVIGLVEVQEKYSVISNICQMSDIGSGQVVIVDNQSSIVYPFYLTAFCDQEFFAQWYKNNSRIYKDDKTVTRLYDSKTKSWYVVLTKYSDFTKWTVIYALPEKDFTKPIFRILKIIVIIGFIGTVLSFGVAYIIATYIYIPLRELKKKVENFDYQNIDTIGTIEAELDFKETDAEITVLNNTFDAMMFKLKNSVEETIMTRSQVQKAYYKILQSQINPHFLHNTISVISIIGKKLGDKRIPDICGKLTDLLKYTVNINEDYVTIEDEMKNILNYLGLLKYRYEHRLEYVIEIDSSLYHIKIPRMTFQPFVENSLKHGLYGIKGPIRISIQGRVFDQGWEIVISDNGRGVQEPELSQLLEAIDRFSKGETSLENNQDSRVKGLGILNTFMRLKILLGSRLEFRISNRVKGGTEIIINVTSDDIDESSR